MEIEGEGWWWWWVGGGRGGVAIEDVECLRGCERQENGEEKR